jgi:prepilin-type N-terminal cleavage/methylation domain-containing protein
MNAPTPDKPRFQFELKHAFYAIAIFGASLGLCGLAGLIVAPFVLLCWWCAFRELRKEQRRLAKQLGPASTAGPMAKDANGDEGPPRSAGFTLAELLVVIAIIAILMLLLRSINGPYLRHHWHAMQISTALQMYHQQFGCLPPAYVCDKSGRPAHSWRVLVLPQLGYSQLYQRYRFDEPWDGAHNAKLLEEMPREFDTSGGRDDQRRHLTAYQAVIGPETAWPGAVPRRTSELTDEQNGATTVLAVECEARHVPWTSPQDLTEPEAIECLMEPLRFPQGHWYQGFFWSCSEGRVFITTDTYWVALPKDVRTLHELLSVNDGRPDRYVPWCAPRQTIIHYANFARLAFFLIVAFWPIRWLWAEKRRARAEAHGERIARPPS